jgi:hypothetical protein
MPTPAKKSSPKTKLALSAAPKKETQPRAPRKKVVPISESKNVSPDEIAKLAYALWLSRGSQGGSPEEDWIAAERQLLQA